MRIRASHKPQEVPFGPFRVYADEPAVAPAQLGQREEESPRGVDPENAAMKAVDDPCPLAAPSSGRWYVKFIHMVRASEPGLDYESKWATLTFEIH